MRKCDVYRWLLKIFPLLYIFFSFLSDIRKNNFSGRTTSGGTFFCGFPYQKVKSKTVFKLYLTAVFKFYSSHIRCFFTVQARTVIFHQEGVNLS